MNIITAIQDALTAFAFDAKVFLLQNSREENEQLNYTVPVVVVSPDWQTKTELTQGFELINERNYEIVFKQLDEWDNSDNDPTDYGASTADKVEEMQTLANSVLSYLLFNRDRYGIKDIPAWNSEAIIRRGNGTMSGVKIKTKIKYLGDRICPTN